MMKRSLLLLFLGIVLLAIVTFFLFLQQRNSAVTQNYLTPTSIVLPEKQLPGSSRFISATLPSATPLMDVTTPQDIVRTFYTWYLSSPQNPVVSGAYLHNKYLSADFKDQITSLATHSQTYDPVLCNQNKSQNFSVGDPTYNDLGNQAKVVVRANIANGKDLYRFVLNYITGKWLIVDVICIP
jgi:hypothetical protein